LKIRLLFVEVGLSQIIWTRSVDNWQQDYQVAQKLNIDMNMLLHIPCVSFSAVPVHERVPAANYVIFHSSNAVRFAMAQDALAASVSAAVKIFSIGEGTTKTLKAFGLSATPGFAANSAKQLADQILDHGVGGSFLIPTTTDSAFDSAAYLQSHGRSAIAVPCYKTTRKATHANGQEFKQAEISAIAKKFSGVICFASPSAVEGFCSVFKIETYQLDKKLVAIAIGATTQNEVLKYFNTCYRSSENSVSSLFKEAQKQIGKIGEQS